MNPRDRFAAHLCKARLTAGLTQEELADRCYLHRTEVSLLERGGREPRQLTLIGGLGGVIATLLAAPHL